MQIIINKHILTKGYLIFVGVLVFMTISCKKDWLDAKPDKSLTVPTTVRDFQALLDNTIGSGGFNGNHAMLDEVGAGDFYVSDADLNSASPIVQRTAYVWASDIYQDETGVSEWTDPYGRILYTNIILEGIGKINPVTSSEVADWRQVKGSALFFRAFNFYGLAKLFCLPFDPSTATSDLGIPLRLTSDFNEPTIRSSVAETYNQILEDLKHASDILPVSVPFNDLYKLRPTKNAAYAMLARVYLAMANYDSALVYSDKALQLNSVLLDFNVQSSSPTASSVSPAANISFSRFNNEVIFHARANTWTVLGGTRLIVDTSLRRLYHNKDLRRSVYFRKASATSNDTLFKGSYDGGSTLFAGIATNEMFLIRAECKARTGNFISALSDVNTVYQKRWNNGAGSFEPITASTSTEALFKILLERRKELCFRGIRWSDLRRLNKEPQYAITLKRIANGNTYILPPNSPLYVLPLPPLVISLTGIPQNPR